MKIKKFNESWNSTGMLEEDREKVGFKEYFIVQNFKDFRNKEISFLLFSVRKVMEDEKSIQMEQLRYYIKGKLEISFGKYKYQTEYIDYFKPHIVYQSNDKKEAEEMLDILQLSKNYNL